MQVDSCTGVQAAPHLPIDPEAFTSHQAHQSPLQSPTHQCPSDDYVDGMDSPPPLPPPLPPLPLLFPTAPSVNQVASIPTQPSYIIPVIPASSVTPPVLPPVTPLLLTQPSSFDTAWTGRLVAPQLQDFIGSGGPTVAIPDTPLSIFKLYYTADLVQLITDQSNLYAKEVMNSERFEQWEKLTTRDLEAFLGFNILMGINSLPAIYDYWKKDPIYHYAPIADHISRDRFREIGRYLHYADNSTLSPPGSPDYDRLGKVRPLLTYLQSRFSAVYTPGRELAVDEAMIKFQGRSSLKQYMPKKPIKRGIKVWVLADSANGYFCRLEVYTGKKGPNPEKNLGERVVKGLTKDFHGRWHRVYFDNFFTSKKLICDLEVVGLYGCGTARKDRKGFPEDLKNAKFKTR